MQPGSDEPLQTEGAEARSPTGTLVAIAALLIAAAAARVLAAQGDLWFDEVWTWMLVRDLDSALDIFVMHHDNNHYLNSLIYYWLGEDASPISYRVPALFASMSTMILAIWVSWQRSRLDALITAFLFCISFVLILYGSEARGYGLATFFCLAGFIVARRILAEVSDPNAADPGAGLILLFGGCVILSVLAHLSSVLVYGAIGLWSMAVQHRRNGFGLPWLLRLTRMHALPMAFIAWIYWLDVSHIEVVPGEPENFMRVLMQVVAHVVRLPRAVASEGVMCALGLAATLYLITRMQRRGDLEWVFLMGIVASGPLIYGASLVIFDNLPYVIRYFLVCYVFLLMAFSRSLADLFRSGIPGRVVVALLLVAVTIGNGQLTLDLYDKQRGAYLEALEDIAEATAQPWTAIASDEDLQNGFLVLYHARQLETDTQLVYLPHSKRKQNHADWFILHSYNRFHVPEPRLRRQGLEFSLVRSYPAGPYSGWPWYVYKRVPADDRG